MTTPTAITEVTVENGDLVSVSRKDASVLSENLQLLGTELVLTTGKVLRFNGNVYSKSSKTVIGTFTYTNNGGSEGPIPPASSYESSVRITNEAYADKQVEATEALLLGIAKFSQLPTSTLCN